jgi:HEAT repeat protein
MKNGRRAALAAAAVLAFADTTRAAELSEKEQAFLKEIQCDDAAVQFKAWSRSGEMSAGVIAPLAELMNSDKPSVAKTAFESLDQIVHSVGKKPTGERREAVVNALLQLAADGKPTEERIAAYRWLSLVGSESNVEEIAKAIHDPALMEEVVFCLERIPSKKPIAALIEALKKETKKEHKMRIMAALGRRKAEDAIDLCAEHIGSPDNDLAIAAMKATARIGKRPTIDIRLPDYDSLSPVQQTDFVDSYLRYADARAKDGALGDALEVFGFILNNSMKEHHVCAAIVGVAKIGRPDTVPAIVAKMSDKENNVRILAKKALIAMKGAEIEAKLKEAAQHAEGKLKEALDEVLKARS